MENIFSDSRLIDYIILLDLDVVSFNPDKRKDKFYRYIEENFNNTPNFKYKVINYFPKNLNDEPSMFEHFFQHLPNEEILSTKPENKYFTYSYIKKTGVYFANFLKIYEEIKQDSVLYQAIPDDYFINKTTNIREKKHAYCPKYLVCLSKHPFFISFKSLLEEIYFHSFNSTSDIKIESILNYLLFRVSLPKYDDTQISFVINSKQFQFNNNITYSEVSLKLLFSLVSIENIVKLFFGIITNSTIILVHSNIEIITPIMYSLLSFLLPFPNNFSIITNLTHNLLEMLDYPIYLMVGIYKPDFGDISLIIRKFSLNKTSYVICDLDNNGIISFMNEMNYDDIKVHEESFIRKLSKLSNLYEPTNKNLNQKSQPNLSSKNQWKHIQNEFFDKIQFHPYVNSSIKKKTLDSEGKNKGKIFKENKIRALFLEFLVSLFDQFDETKHFDFNQKNNIFKEKEFINDSKQEYRTLLSIIVKLPYFEIFIYNILESQHSDKMKIINQKKKKDDKVVIKIENFEVRFDVFKRAVEKRKQKKSLGIIFKHNINHTISLPNVCPEIVNYKQHPIFENRFHDIEVFKHRNFLDFSTCKFAFSAIYMNKEITRLYRSSFSLNHNKNLLEEFLKIYKEKFSLYNRFFGTNVKPASYEKVQQVRSLSSKTIRSKYLAKEEENKGKYRDSINKEDYIKYFTDYCMKSKRGEFNLNYEYNVNFGNYVIQTTSKCTLCKSPNSLWEIRRNIRFSKNKQESKVTCKGCKKSFIAHFIVIDIEDEEAKNDITETYISDITNINIYQGSNKQNDLAKQNNKIYEKIEYMSTEQIVFNIYKNNKLCLKDENKQKQSANDKRILIDNKSLKKVYPALYYNLLLFFGDNKIRVSNRDDAISIFNVEEFVDDFFTRMKGEINSENNFFILCETQIRPKDESLEKLRLQKKAVENLNKIKKIDLTTLKDEKKYEKFNRDSQNMITNSQKMLLYLSQMNSQNYSKYFNKDQTIYNNNAIDMNSSLGSSNYFSKKSSNFDIMSIGNYNRSKSKDFMFSQNSREIEFNNNFILDRNSINNNEILSNNTSSPSNYNFFRQGTIGGMSENIGILNNTGNKSTMRNSLNNVNEKNKGNLLIFPIEYDKLSGRNTKLSRKSSSRYKDMFLKKSK